MFKTVFFIFLLMQSFMVFSRVEMRWLTVASLVLDDGESRILFDPMFTRASILNWLNIKKLKSDEKLVKAELEKLDLMKVDAIFASHSHFDHVIDAPTVSKLTGAVFYVDKNSLRIAKAYKDPLIKTSSITALRPIQVGKFKITPIVRTHSPIFLGIHFLSGEVPVDFDFGFYDYRVGDTWFYYITHPDGKILIDQGSAPFLDKAQSLTKDVDVLIQGVANRKSDEAVLDGYVKHLVPKTFVPSHFDNFVFGFDSKSDSDLPGIKLDRILTKMQDQYPLLRVVKPKYGEKIVLLNGKLGSKKGSRSSL